MIRIDLLPPELKKADRTPPGQLLATLGLVALFFTTAAGAAWGWFGVVGEAQNQARAAQELLESKRPQVAYCDKLESEKKDFSERLDHIKKFSDSRILWTKKLDQLASIVDSPAEDDRHQVWFEDLKMDMTGGREMGLRMAGFSASGELARMNNFHMDLRSGEFAREFNAISNPAGEVVANKDFDPAEAFKFEFMLSVDDPAADAKAAKKPAKAPAKPAPKAN